ncbi:hypothetical chloroplast RF21, chloroplastic [Tanacetum coccineum]
MSKTNSQAEIVSEEQLVPRANRLVIKKNNQCIASDSHITDTMLRFDVEILRHHKLYKLVSLTATVPIIYLHQFWKTINHNKNNQTFTFKLDTHTFTLTRGLLRTILQMPPPDPNNTYTKPPSENQILGFIKTLSYDEDPNTKMIAILWGIVHSANLDIASLIWDEFEWQSVERSFRPSNMSKLLYTRFTKLIINHFLSNNTSIPRRSSSKLHGSQDDQPITKLSNAVKGDYKFGMEIPDIMISDAIKKLAGYKFYMAKKVESENAKIVDEPEEQHVSPVKSGRGKGFMCYGDQVVNVPNKPKKDVVLRKTRSLTIAEETLVGPAVDDPAVQSLLDLQKGSKARKLESLKQKKHADAGEGSIKNETDDADESDMDLSDDNPDGDDDATGRSDDKEYEFSYADLPRLSLNDVEDMYLLQVQDKLHHLPLEFVKEFNNALLLFIRRVVIQNRLSEVKKFCDGTLEKIYENLIDMVKRNKSGTDNKRLKGRDWTDIHVKKSNEMVYKIGKVLKRREQLRRLEEYVGGRPKTINPRTFVRPIYHFDYRVTLGFGSIAGGLEPVSPVIRLPIEHGINTGTRIEMGDDVDINTITLEQYMALIRDDIRPGLVKPEIGNDVEFVINSNFMRELRRKHFVGTDDEDAHEHVRRVLEIIDLFHFPGVTHDAGMLRVFPITLKGQSLRWNKRLPAGVINTWNLLKKEFIWQYCSPFKTAKKLEEIRNFKQEMNETLYQAWERGISNQGVSSKKEDKAVEQSKYMGSLEETIIKLCDESIKKQVAGDEWIRRSIESTKSDIMALKTMTKNLQEKAYQLTQTVLTNTGEKRTTTGKGNMKESVPRDLPPTPFQGHLKKQMGSSYRIREIVCMIKNPREVHKMKAQEDEGDMDVGWDIVVKDVERLRQFLTPTIHTLPNVKPVMQPYMPLGPVHDKEKVVREEEQDYNIPLHDGVIQPLTPQTVHITPPDDDYVAPATSLSN